MFRGIMKRAVIALTMCLLLQACAVIETPVRVVKKAAETVIEAAECVIKIPVSATSNLLNLITDPLTCTRDLAEGAVGVVLSAIPSAGSSNAKLTPMAPGEYVYVDEAQTRANFCVAETSFCRMSEMSAEDVGCLCVNPDGTSFNGSTKHMNMSKPVEPTE